MRPCLLSCLGCFVLTQCVLTNTDPSYVSLEQSAIRDPSPQAIIGMWHRLDHRKAAQDSTTSLMFHRDGTLETVGQVLLFGRSSDSHQKQRYRYVGDGVWQVIGTRMEFRLSMGRLLMQLPIPQYSDCIRYVFVRVD